MYPSSRHRQPVIPSCKNRNVILPRTLEPNRESLLIRSRNLGLFLIWLPALSLNQALSMHSPFLPSNPATDIESRPPVRTRRMCHQSCQRRNQQPNRLRVQRAHLVSIPMPHLGRRSSLHLSRESTFPRVLPHSLLSRRRTLLVGEDHR